MTWRVEFTRRAEKDIEQLSTKDQRRILEFLNQRVSAHPNPRALAKRLTATKEEAWRFRVGDYRIIAQFHDSRLVVLVVEVGNRREVYR
ncbi:type II toxin-antitoxin system RelE/ParE family toxin [Mesorhizobium sp. B283B1A]|uniref:type II toxin-antitoxin system RelE family toxin n=1 Tax=Mesorhizobium TaxID=68287 RepID=UPI0003CF328E|nr:MULTISPECIES: type II toxin-antitoxin system RelE/ParE family toxin [Mesorhizobium]ESY68499.1 translation repressor RelE [Mesorhizobium sp. LNHC232B00]MCA0046742.1 type II toxin-antitoxin system RelE/ParE family toxin [Mesorhizobium sp. B283B1A]UQS61898.1 type II toxin-antitoxin system RelE/ParE family toxin [Mesorhizobium opportunistum]WJI41342.1 type II toxin-antitoxin system RelE/ParE family toxin [Mesorhizobium opportunistum]